MSRRSRHRLRQTLRASLLLVIAVCLAWQPVLTALGEVHEATAHAASAVTHGDHSTPHDDPPNGDAEQNGSDGTPACLAALCALLRIHGRLGGRRIRAARRGAGHGKPTAADIATGGRFKLDEPVPTSDPGLTLGWPWPANRP
ncbi:MAG: hypothetical protein IPH99_11900 [Xanthomonadales bacterium]|nr:hypothetical protein [Xanthomonadales bacterium]